jgi:hypothetical protein
MPKVGEECEYFTTAKKMLPEHCNLHNNCIVDTWESGDRLEVLILINYGSLTPVVRNMRTGDVSTINEKLTRPIQTPRELAIEKAELLLLPFLRQLKHNNGDEGFVFAYELDGVKDLVRSLVEGDV